MQSWRQRGFFDRAESRAGEPGASATGATRRDPSLFWPGLPTGPHPLVVARSPDRATRPTRPTAGPRPDRGDLRSAGVVGSGDPTTTRGAAGVVGSPRPDHNDGGHSVGWV